MLTTHVPLMDHSVVISLAEEQQVAMITTAVASKVLHGSLLQVLERVTFFMNTMYLPCVLLHITGL